MILIEKWTGREVNTSELEEKLARAVKELKDDRIVKPKKFKISDIDQKSLMNGIFADSCEDIEERMSACNGKVLWSKTKYAEGEEAGYDAVFKAVTPNVTELVHQAPIYYVTGKGTIYTDMADTFVKSKTIGDPVFKIKNRLGGVIGNPTYLKERNTDEKDFLGGANDFYLKDDLPPRGVIQPYFAYWSFDVSVPELLKTRAVFYDPEGVDTDHEFQKTFVVFGGIPIQAVKNARIEVKSYEELKRKK